MNFKTLLTCGLALLAFGCAENQGEDQAISRPATNESDSRDIPVNTSPGQTSNFDPAKQQAAAEIFSFIGFFVFASFEVDEVSSLVILCL